MSRSKARLAYERLTVALLVVALGCGSDAPPPPAGSGIDDLLSCDITERDCQESIYASVAEWLGSDPGQTPAIRTITVAEFESELRASVGPDDYADAESLTRGLQLIGMVGDDVTSLVDAQIDNLVGSVLAFFDPEDDRISVIDRAYEDVEAQALLAHEFVHVIQDLEFGFDAIQAGVETEDEFIAMRSVIEGDAEHNSIAWAFDRLEVPLTAEEWDAIHEESSNALRETARDEGINAIDLGGTFPYVYGREFVTDAILAEGMGVRETLWNAGPTRSLDVMSGYFAFRDSAGPTHDVPEVAYPMVPPGYVSADTNELGAWNIFAFLRRHGVADDLALGAALASVGDTFTVYQDLASTVAVWRLRFGPTMFDVENIVSAAVQADARFWTTRTSGNDIFVVSADTQNALDAWLEQPIEGVAASVVPKGAAHRFGGPISRGTCVARMQGAQLGRFGR